MVAGNPIFVVVYGGFLMVSKGHQGSRQCVCTQDKKKKKENKENQASFSFRFFLSFLLEM